MRRVVSQYAACGCRRPEGAFVVHKGMVRCLEGNGPRLHADTKGNT